MVLSVLFIAVIACLLSLPDICALVSIYGFQEDIRESGPADYTHIRRRFGLSGLCYVLLVDLIRAMIAALLGAALLKKAGYPEIGKLLMLFFTVFFMLAGRAFPLVPDPKTRRSLIYPALLLAFVDWRVFLVFAVLCGVVHLLTGLQGLAALLSAVIFPLFSLIFGNWWLFNYLMLLSGLSLAFAYLDEIFRSIRRLPRSIEDIPLRLQSIGGKIRKKLEESTEEDNP